MHKKKDAIAIHYNFTAEKKNNMNALRFIRVMKDSRRESQR